MEDAEREMWCEAWRLIREHGDEAIQVIDSEITQALHMGDKEGVAHWRQLANAIEELAN